MKFRLDSLTPQHRAGLVVLLLLPLLLAGVAIYALADGTNVAVTLQRIERADAEGTPTRLRAANEVWLRADSHGLAEAELERRAGDVLVANRLTQGSMAVAQSERDGAIGLDVSATGTLAGLRRALFAFETEKPIIFVRRLDIRQAGQPSSPAAPMPLEIRMRLEAYLRSKDGT